MGAKVSATAVGAWLLVAVYYFYQYALRSAPSVMMPQLTEAFGVNALGVSAIVGMFYYGYSPFSLVAGAALDRFGARWTVPVGPEVIAAARRGDWQLLRRGADWHLRAQALELAVAAPLPAAAASAAAPEAATPVATAPCQPGKLECPGESPSMIGEAV